MSRIGSLLGIGILMSQVMESKCAKTFVRSQPIYVNLRHEPSTNTSVFVNVRQYMHRCLQGVSAHALIFSWACWSGIWPRLDGRRRLAGPKWMECLYPPLLDGTFIPPHYWTE